MQTYNNLFRKAITAPTNYHNENKKCRTMTIHIIVRHPSYD